MAVLLLITEHHGVVAAFLPSSQQYRRILPPRHHSSRTLPTTRLKMAAPLEPPAVTLEQVSCTHDGGDTWQLEEANYVLPRRGKVALVGRNGAGKSSLLRIVMAEYQQQQTSSSSVLVVSRTLRHEVHGSRDGAARRPRGLRGTGASHAGGRFGRGRSAGNHNETGRRIQQQQQQGQIRHGATVPLGGGAGHGPSGSLCAGLGRHGGAVGRRLGRSDEKRRRSPRNCACDIYKNSPCRN